MDDMERYGDYNEIDAPPGKNKLLLFLKAIVILAILAVAVILGVRIFLYNYYPDEMKAVYSDDRLKEYFAATDGNVGAKTQELRIPYDDPETGAFFCDNLIVIDALGRVQINLRYNTSTMEFLEQKYGISGLDPLDAKLFTFTLYRHDEKEKVEFNESTVEGELISSDFEAYAMYGCYRLVFDGVELGDNAPCCLMLGIHLRGVADSEPYGVIRIYENNGDYSDFDDFSIKENDLK